MNKKLQALEASGKASLNRLLSMEQQFHRIDDMDKKLAAVNKTLDAATKQLELSTSTHQEISSDMADLKVNTAQQFTEMNQRLLSNMECQHKMSTTLLDLGGHFEKMSAFMEGLATKM
jgi:DNA repair ATPase RecN